MVHLRDANGLVLSIPPVTNCNQTRLTSATRNLFLEVSGADRLDLCKSVMDKLVYWLAEHCASDVGVLRVEQARVICADTGLTRVLYPSATDLAALPEGMAIRRP